MPQWVMTSDTHGDLPAATPDDESATKSRWALPTISTKTKAILAVGTVVVLVVAYFILQRLLPDWWGTTMGDQIGRSLASGIGWGLFYGVLGSALPLLLALLAILWIGKGPRSILSWVTGLVAVLLTIPNLLTLAVTIGTGQGARAGRLQLEMFGPGFRGATLIGVIVGIVIGVAIDFYLLGRRRAKRKATAPRTEKPTKAPHPPA